MCRSLTEGFGFPKSFFRARVRKRGNHPTGSNAVGFRLTKGFNPLIDPVKLASASVATTGAKRSVLMLDSLPASSPQLLVCFSDKKRGEAMGHGRRDVQK